MLGWGAVSCRLSAQAHLQLPHWLIKNWHVVHSPLLQASHAVPSLSLRSVQLYLLALFYTYLLVGHSPNTRHCRTLFRNGLFSRAELSCVIWVTPSFCTLKSNLGGIKIGRERLWRQPCRRSGHPSRVKARGYRRQGSNGSVFSRLFSHWAIWAAGRFWGHGSWVLVPKSIRPPGGPQIRIPKGRDILQEFWRKSLVLKLPKSGIYGLPYCVLCERLVWHWFVGK